MNNFESLVSLNLIPQIGSARLDELLGYFGQPQDIFDADRDILERLVGGRIGEGIAAANREIDTASAYQYDEGRLRACP